MCIRDRKLARHYNREIQIAVVTRGVTTNNNFEVFLQEYMGISNRTNNEFQKVNEQKTRQVDEHKNFQKRGWMSKS